MMEPLVLKLIGISKAEPNGCWEVCLTDLNSQGAFKIQALLTPRTQIEAVGIITKAPDSFSYKSMHIRILAGFNKDDDEQKFYVDASGCTNPVFKSFDMLEKEDRFLVSFSE